MVTAGADVEGNPFQSEGRPTPLQQVLLASNTATKLKSKQGMDVFEIDIARYLIEQGASVNLFHPETFPPLHLAVVRNSPEMVEYLISSGANKDQIDSSGLTALGMACVNKYGNYLFHEMIRIFQFLFLFCLFVCLFVCLSVCLLSTLSFAITFEPLEVETSYLACILH